MASWAWVVCSKWFGEGGERVGPIMGSKGLEEARVDGWHCVIVEHQFFQPKKQILPGLGAVGVWACQEMQLVHTVMLATRAMVVVPFFAVQHHHPKGTEPTNMFGDPEVVQRGKEVGCHHHSIPVDVIKGLSLYPCLCSSFQHGSVHM